MNLEKIISLEYEDNTLQEDVTIVAIKGKIKYPYTFKAGTNPEIIQKAIDYRIANHWVVYRL